MPDGTGTASLFHCFMYRIIRQQDCLFALSPIREYPSRFRVASKTAEPPQPPIGGEHHIRSKHGLLYCGSWRFAAHHRLAISHQIPLSPFDVILLTDALTVRRGSWRLCYVTLAAAYKSLNTDMNGSPVFCQGTISEREPFPFHFIGQKTGKSCYYAASFS